MSAESIDARELSPTNRPSSSRWGTFVIHARSQPRKQVPYRFDARRTERELATMEWSRSVFVRSWRTRSVLSRIWKRKRVESSSQGARCGASDVNQTREDAKRPGVVASPGLFIPVRSAGPHAPAADGKLPTPLWTASDYALSA